MLKLGSLSDRYTCQLQILCVAAAAHDDDEVDGSNDADDVRVCLGVYVQVREIPFAGTFGGVQI